MLQFKIDPVDLFSYLIRSSYLAAPFLTDEERKSIDKSLMSMLQSNGKDIQGFFLGLQSEHKKTISAKESVIFITKGIAEFTMNINNRKILLGTKILPKIKQ